MGLSFWGVVPCYTRSRKPDSLKTWGAETWGLFWPERWGSKVPIGRVKESTRVCIRKIAEELSGKERH